MNIIDEMAQDTLSDEYFHDLFIKAERIYCEKILQDDITCDIDYSEKELIDVLTFADILSLSSFAECKNLSLKIISCLNVKYNNNPKYNYFAKGIMLRFGNFPGYNIINDNNVKIDSIDIEIEKSAKKKINKDKNSEKIFTDSQKEVLDKLENKNHFSFSGPTSFGKSFILTAFINEIIINSSGTNFVFLVPTRALVSQTLKKLKDIAKMNNYVISASPDIPIVFRKQSNNYIFVFTPERLLHYFSNNANPNIEYVFVDEAQKIISNDTRSAIYYHAISIAERKSCKLFFASPNVKNTELFLKLFNKTIDESLSINESPVCQTRVFIDIINKDIKLFSDTGKIISMNYCLPTNLYELIKVVSKNIDKSPKSLIYCNTISDTFDCAINMAKYLQPSNSKALLNASNEIASFIHKDYYLVDLLKKGIGFHFGKLPQRVRDIIERLYEEGEIQYLFCTSTLLEGVNLPAQNIFILNNQIGNKDFKTIDFWNLAGRAGRLAKELCGNVICVRWIEKDGRWNTIKSQELIKNKDLEELDSEIITGKSNFYKNIYNVALDRPFTRKDISDEQRRLYNAYSNILINHYCDDSSSMLKNQFQHRIVDGSKELSKIKNDLEIPNRILTQFPLIKTKYQNDIWNFNDFLVLGDPNYENCLEALKWFYKIYHWDIEESGGRNPLVSSRDKSVLKHYASLMTDWMNSKSINEIVAKNIHNHIGRTIKLGYENNSVNIAFFDINNKEHLNVVINKTISEIDTIVRFTLKTYFENYYSILENKFGKSNTSQNWSLYMEHGTKNIRLIEIQSLGIPRHLSKYFETNYLDFLTFNDQDELVSIDFDGIREKVKSIDKNAKSAECVELIEVLENNNLL